MKKSFKPKEMVPVRPSSSSAAKKPSGATQVAKLNFSAASFLAKANGGADKPAPFASQKKPAPAVQKASDLFAAKKPAPEKKAPEPPPPAPPDEDDDDEEEEKEIAQPQPDEEEDEVQQPDGDDDDDEEEEEKENTKEGDDDDDDEFGFLGGEADEQEEAAPTAKSPAAPAPKPSKKAERAEPPPPASKETDDKDEHDEADAPSQDGSDDENGIVDSLPRRQQVDLAALEQQNRMDENERPEDAEDDDEEEDDDDDAGNDGEASGNKRGGGKGSAGGRGVGDSKRKRAALCAKPTGNVCSDIVDGKVEFWTRQSGAASAVLVDPDSIVQSPPSLEKESFVPFRIPLESWHGSRATRASWFTDTLQANVDTKKILKSLFISTLKPEANKREHHFGAWLPVVLSAADESASKDLALYGPVPHGKKRLLFYAIDTPTVVSLFAGLTPDAIEQISPGLSSFRPQKGQIRYIYRSALGHNKIEGWRYVTGDSKRTQTAGAKRTPAASAAPKVVETHPMVIHDDEDDGIQRANDDPSADNAPKDMEEDTVVDNTAATQPTNKKRKHSTSSIMEIELPAGMAKSAFFPVNVPISSKTRRLKLSVVLEED